jgi:hypothetical protein
MHSDVSATALLKSNSAAVSSIIKNEKGSSQARATSSEVFR